MEQTWNIGGAEVEQRWSRGGKHRGGKNIGGKDTRTEVGQRWKTRREMEQMWNGEGRMGEETLIYWT